MPAFKPQEVKTLYLPTTKDEPNEADRAWVKVITKLTPKQLAGIEETDTKIKVAMELLANIVTEWNMTEADGTTPAPIDTDHISQLDFEDFTFLGKYVEELYSTQSAGVPTPLKENSSSTS